MARSARKAGSSIALLLVLLGCGDGDIDADLFFGGLPAPKVDRPKPVSTYRLRLVDTFGTEDGPLAFGRIGSLAVSDAGVLAVADDQSCQIVRVDLVSGELVDRFGRCGGGPGEFKSLGPIGFRGDSIIAFDQGKRQLEVIGPGGEVVRTITPDLMAMSAVTVTDLISLDDTTIIAGLALLPTREVRESGRDRRNGFIATLDARSGAVRNRFLLDPPVAVENANSLIRSKRICMSDGGNRPLLAAMNDWVFEGLLVAPDSAKPVAHFATTVPWLEAYKDKFGELTPGGLRGSVGCGADAFLFMQPRYERNVGVSTRVVGSFIEVRSREGDVAPHPET